MASVRLCAVFLSVPSTFSSVISLIVGNNSPYDMLLHTVPRMIMNDDTARNVKDVIAKTNNVAMNNLAYVGIFLRLPEINKKPACTMTPRNASNPSTDTSPPTDSKITIFRLLIGDIATPLKNNMTIKIMYGLIANRSLGSPGVIDVLTNLVAWSRLKKAKKRLKKSLLEL